MSWVVRVPRCRAFQTNSAFSSSEQPYQYDESQIILELKSSSTRLQKWSCLFVAEISLVLFSFFRSFVLPSDLSTTHQTTASYAKSQSVEMMRTARMPQPSQNKENDPSMGKLKRLSSITALTTPINQFASKLRRPSTALPPLKSVPEDKHRRRDSMLPRSCDTSYGSTSVKDGLDAPPPSLRSTPNLHLPSWAPTPPPRTLQKSKTMYNLPTLSRREPSYEPLPSSQSSTNLPQSRVPTPVSSSADTYKKSKQIGASRAFAGLRKAGTSLPRSSTQPNLTAGLQTPRRPAFKESLAGVQEDSGGERKNAFSIPRKQVQTSMRNTSSSFAPLRTQEAPRTVTAFQRTNETWPKTPIKQTVKASWPRKSVEEEYFDEVAAPSTVKPLSKRDSQLRRSFEGEITHRQLMQPLSPPLPKLPAGYTDAGIINSPSLGSARLVRQVSQAQPESYWCGRFASLNDRLLNEQLAASTALHKPFERGKEDDMTKMAIGMHGEAHALRIFDLLWAACVSEEAMGSLRAFQTKFAKKSELPNLAYYTPTSVITLLAQKAHAGSSLQSISGNVVHLGQSRRDVSGETATTEERKSSVMSNSASTMTSVESTVTSGKKTSFIDRLLMGRMGPRRTSGKGAAITGDEDGEKEALLK